LVLSRCDLEGPKGGTTVVGPPLPKIVSSSSRLADSSLFAFFCAVGFVWSGSLAPVLLGLGAAKVFGACVASCDSSHSSGMGWFDCEV
jgi:hypothetical protein